MHIDAPKNVIQREYRPLPDSSECACVGGLGWLSLYYQCCANGYRARPRNGAMNVRNQRRNHVPP